MVKNAVEIETERLILRPMVRGDFEGWASLMRNVESSRFLDGPQSREVAWRGFMAMAGAWALERCGMFSAIEKSTGRWIGRVGPWCPEGWPGTEIGWAFLPEAWGKGYATEGATAAADWAFSELNWSEVVHVIAVDNFASQAVARRLGSVLRGPGRFPEPRQNEPVEIWGQTREEWACRKPMLR
ncbi:GNAT family N-acetyltransferase [Massilia sp. erpn]|uniref:GNAT family N-acetyltransferase n=1 Tax=Massilia sp. erpn TaxID=2738142 RepID=UPI002106CC57|nr:GNAT family N-acetyltransferase [Massilia sp. erpn]UTY59279.1 GNAT family N-acetyltransferase [Massilia sp. erpn]